MKINETAKKHADSCRFCWMCHHICPVGNATGHERSTARARALGISLVERGALRLDEIIDNIYECAECGACAQTCTTGWDPVLFTSEVRLQAALDGALPPYIDALVQNALHFGNAYGKEALSDELKDRIARHQKKTDTLFYLGSFACARANGEAAKAIRALEKAGEEFTVLSDEKQSGAELDFLIGKAGETKDAMQAAADQLSAFSTVVFYEALDLKACLRLWGENGVKKSFAAKSFPAHLSALLDAGRITLKQTGEKAAFQDPYPLSRDLEETKEARKVVSAARELSEMLLHGRETV